MLSNTHKNMNAGGDFREHGYILSWECISYNAISQTIEWSLSVTSTILHPWAGTLYINDTTVQNFSGSNTYTGTVTLTKAANNYGILNLKVITSKPYAYEHIYEDRVLIGGEFVIANTWGAYGATESYGNTFNWTRTSFTEGNSLTTRIYWNVTAWGITPTSEYTAIPDVYIDDIKVGDKNTTSGTYTINHKADGSGSFTVKLDDKTETFIVAPLRQRTSITYAPNFNDEESPTITYSGNNLVDKVEACLLFEGDSSYVIEPREVNKEASSYTFNFTDVERKELRQGITRGAGRKIQFCLRTLIGSEYYYEYTTKNFYLINYDPIFNPSVIDVNSYTVNLTGDNNKLIKYFSNAYFNTGAQARKEATIVYQKIINGSTTLDDYTSNTGTINNVDSNTFYFSAEDSRGVSNNGFLVKSIDNGDFIEYTKLTAALTLDYLTLAGELHITIKGNYFDKSFGLENNYIAFKYALIKNGEEIGTYGMNPYVTTSGDRYVAEYTITGLDPDASYEVYVDVTDALMHVQSNAEAIAATPVFDWGKNDFKHNTPVYLTKNNDLRVVDNNGNDKSVLNPCDSNGNLSIGLGQYQYADGSTDIYGNSLYLNAKNSINLSANNVNINAIPIGGEVLWQGAYFMNASQTARLSTPISELINGIVLVFSLYTDGAQDSSFNTFFVSKKEVELLPGAPHTFFMMINSGFSVIGAKYLYIYDDRIVGQDSNASAGTNNNMTYANNRFVLRYVIGV